VNFGSKPVGSSTFKGATIKNTRSSAVNLIETVAREPADFAFVTRSQPGLADVDELVERVRRTGLPAELVVEGERVPAPVGIDLSAYRIVPEALTNTLKHVRATSAGVAVRYEPGEVTVEVVDDGAGGAVEANGGHGLIGMRERVALYGGELRAGLASST